HATAELLRTLVNQALNVMPDGGDLTVTGWTAGDHVELELADTGVDIENRSRTLPLVAAAIGAKLDWRNCPQGGGAVTIRFAAESMQQRKAA
ncbi:MAG: ATPase, partial [Planctomycetota bacterium]